jgi:type I restriction enzyme S subunit
MASPNWHTQTLGEVVTLKRGYDLSTSDRLLGNIPVVSSSGITGFHNEAKVKGPGVVTGRYGTLGEVFYIVDDYWPLNTTLYVQDFKCNHPRFVYYLLGTLGFANRNDKSSVPGLNRNDLHQIHVKIPPPPQQCAIADILRAFDYKIDLNRRMNETLEAIARALFKSWFVDFDIVRAKAEGRQPAGMDTETAALFSVQFQDTRIGQLPHGWSLVPLSKVASNRRAGILPQDVQAKTPYIGLQHMPRGSIALAEWGKAGDVSSNKFSFRQGDILFGKLRPYFRKVGVAVTDGVCSTDILVIAPTTPEWFGFVLGHISSGELISVVDAASTGTKMPRANWDEIARFEVALPPLPLARAFNDIISPMIHQIQANILEARTLAALRDALLPKLMSGAMRVDRAKEVEPRTP